MRMRGLLLSFSLFLILALAASACETTTQEPIRVRILADGREVVQTSNEPKSVREILQQAGIPVGDLDRINPSDFTPITDGMVITVVRVENRPECVEDVLPYSTDTIRTPDLAPGESRIMQAGVNGTVRVCFDVVIEDGVERSRTQSSRTILTPATNQILALGIDSSRIEPIPISGMLVYESGGALRTLERISTNQGVLATGPRVDSERVLALSDDGRQLLYTRLPETDDDPAIFNELWVLLDTGDPDAQPVRLIIDNVLTADWVPGQPFTFSYSTLQPRDEPPGYQALNDLSVASLDSRTGQILRADPIVQPRASGVYGLWGTQFAWSPDGQRLAWAQADRMGMVDSEAGALRPFLEFAVYTTTLSNGWLWTPSLAWSPDSALLVMSLHGAPLGDETPETSPAFDIAALQPDGRYVVNPVIAQAGMWAAPRYSPLKTGQDGLADGQLAYLQARSPINSVSSEYDLVVADRDGSNQRILFPGKDQPGIRPLEDGSDLAWSPDGSAVAVVYQGDVYVVDVQTGNATQVTLVGNARHPRWVR